MAGCFTIYPMARENVVGQNIRFIRAKRGLTQEELALTSGLSQGYINQLEKGRRNYTQKSLELIAQALSVTVADLLTENAEALSKRPQFAHDNKYMKEIASAISDLPNSIVEHYIALMKMERSMYKKTKK